MSVCQQAKSARRKARQDKRYNSQRGVSASKRAHRLAMKIQGEKDRLTRNALKK